MPFSPKIIGSPILPAIHGGMPRQRTPRPAVRRLVEEGLGLIWAVAPSLERVPGWAAREFKIAEIGTEAKPDARADRHDHDIVCYERRHA
jgi:hypothetical protein